MVQLFCLSAHRALLSTPSLPSSLSPSFAHTRDSLSVTRAKPPVSSCRASYHAASVAATVSASKELYLAAAVGRPRAQLVSSLFHHHTSPSLRLLPGHTRVKDTPLLFRLLSARCSRGISTRGSKTFWHLCLQLSLFVLCLTSLSATSLLQSPLAAPSIYHTGIELRRHACRWLSPVPPPAGLLLWVYVWTFPTLFCLPWAGCVPACLCLF